jgi:hypothetical protein
MINNIRNTVLSIVSKDNRGYVTPEEFNLFSRQAQLEIFTMYMYDIANAVNKQNARLFNGGYSNVPQQLEEVLDRFLIDDVLAYDAINLKFYAPGDNPSQPTEPKPYKVIKLTYDDQYEIEKVNHMKIMNLRNSNIVSPTEEYPVYTLNEHGTSGLSGIQIYPTTITSNVIITYLRYPRDPKWTYSTLSGGEPFFNPSQSDFQDFELPIADSPRLVTRICQMAGVSIREAEVVQLMSAEEQMDAQQKA